MWTVCESSVASKLTGHRPSASLLSVCLACRLAGSGSCSTNTQLGHLIVELVIRRPLVYNLPTNHWESVVENIQCKSTNYLGSL